MSNQYSKKHGMYGTRTYWAWHNMKQRCYNPRHDSYPNYGGRGIKVCEDWKDFKSFYADMGECPEKMTLERVDNTKGYYLENCQWVSHKVQARNRRNNKIKLSDAEEIRRLYATGKFFERELAKKYNVSRSLISHILNGRAW